MNKIRMIGFAVLGLAMTCLTAMAQTGAVAADNEFSVNKNKALLAVVGFAIAVAGGAIGQGRVAASAVEGAARNPSAAGRIQTMMILGLALIESLVLFALVITFLKG